MAEMNRDEKIKDLILTHNEVSHKNLLEMGGRMGLGAKGTIVKAINGLEERGEIYAHKQGRNKIYYVFDMPLKRQLPKDFKEILKKFRKQLTDIEKKFPDENAETQKNINYLLREEYRIIQITIKDNKEYYNKRIATSTVSEEQKYLVMWDKLGITKLDAGFKNKIYLYVETIMSYIKNLLVREYDLRQKRKNMGKSKRRDEITKTMNEINKKHDNLVDRIDRIIMLISKSPFSDDPDTFSKEEIKEIETELESLNQSSI